MKKGKKSIQAKFRKKTFSTHQYWTISYTERYPEGDYRTAPDGDVPCAELDFRVIIKAKSYEVAKKILRNRVKEDNPKVKLKAVAGFMLHSKYQCDARKKRPFTPKDWEKIKSAAFPNAQNALFKSYVPRSPEKSNRYNATDYEHLKSIGFKSGDENWSRQNRSKLSLPEDQRPFMIYEGKWVKWDPQDRAQKLDELRTALRQTRHPVSGQLNKSAAARALNIGRNCLYGWMERFPEIDWDKI